MTKTPFATGSPASWGADFAEGAEPVSLERDGISLSGFAGRPTLNRPDGSLQYLFVNGRPVKDRLLLSAIRGAYQDFIPRGRYPLAALFLEVPVEDVDVNVHPAKAEVRFREASLIRSLMVSALRDTLRLGASVTAKPFSGSALRLRRPSVAFNSALLFARPRSPMSQASQTASPSEPQPDFAPGPGGSFDEEPMEERLGASARSAAQDVHSLRDRGRRHSRGSARGPRADRL